MPRLSVFSMLRNLAKSAPPPPTLAEDGKDSAFAQSEAKRHEFDSDVTTTEVDGLSPTCTFQVKLIVKSASGESEPSDESVVDTLVANCGPDQDKKKCCLIS